MTAASYTIFPPNLNILNFKWAFELNFPNFSSVIVLLVAHNFEHRYTSKSHQSVKSSRELRRVAPPMVLRWGKSGNHLFHKFFARFFLEANYLIVCQPDKGFFFHFISPSRLGSQREFVALKLIYNGPEFADQTGPKCLPLRHKTVHYYSRSIRFTQDTLAWPAVYWELAVSTDWKPYGPKRTGGFLLLITTNYKFYKGGTSLCKKTAKPRKE